MAAAKKAATKAATAETPAPPASGSEEAERAALLEQADQAPIRYDPVLVALSKAEAARQLLVEAGGVFGGESLEWIEGFAEQACFEALEDAKVAYVQAVAAGTAANPKAVADKPAPAPEAAR